MSHLLKLVVYPAFVVMHSPKMANNIFL